MWSRYLIALPQFRKINKILCIYLTRLPVEFKLKAESHWNFSRLHKKALLSRKPIFLLYTIREGISSVCKIRAKNKSFVWGRVQSGNGGGGISSETNLNPVYTTPWWYFCSFNILWCKIVCRRARRAYFGMYKKITFRSVCTRICNMESDP